ncbi:hypothetical protein GOP47_0015749 [Adiantum capillus-veneris]|uniref:Mediator of RNA polymerase II transcription subunit 8 n=1 Tax=Adiantum capillus-veneris TaxID=13818 RepID=A0A9D4UK86_ADICA|nr:hypothetical protein GOP47_0015749 [Adiantum capillus-veneris]
MSTMLQQLNLESIRTRSHDLFTAISSILQSFQTIPHHKWPEVLGQFSMVNVELLNLVEDIKPILKMFVVHPKNVNAENSQILPVMLSSKLLPEMESEEAALKEQILAGVSNLPLQLQTEKLQKQIGMVIKACEFAEKALTENRKLYGLGSRQVPAIIPPLDKAQAAKIAEQEKLLRAAVNMGEGLRLLPSERQQPVSLPQHLVAALQSSDGGSTYHNTGAPKGLSQPSMGALAGVSQQVAAAQILNRNVPSPMPTMGATTLDGAAASPMFANSPRSANTIITDASPQQQQSILQRQKVRQIQKHQQMQQQQQLRQPATPPIGQATHFQHLQHQAQLQLHERNHLQLQHFQQQCLQQQQLQSNSLQSGQQLQQSLGQNHLVAGQMKQHLGPMGSNAAGSLFGNTQMSSNMMVNLGTNIQPQTAMLQQRLHLQGVGMGATGQPQRSLPSQLLADPMYNMGLAGNQNTANLGLPLQQQLVSQSNFNNILNPNQTLNFGQQRQQPPPQ